MPTKKKPMTASTRFSAAQMAAAEAAAGRTAGKGKIDWSTGTVTHGGGVSVTLATLRLRMKRKPRGQNAA